MWRDSDGLAPACARYLKVRRLLLIWRLDDTKRALAELDPARFPPASRAAHEPVVAGIAMCAAGDGPLTHQAG